MWTNIEGVRPDRARKRAASSRVGTQALRFEGVDQARALADRADASNLVVSVAGAGFESVASRGTATGRRTSEGCSGGERETCEEAANAKTIAAASVSWRELADGSDPMQDPGHEREAAGAWSSGSRRRAALGRSNAARLAQEAEGDAWQRQTARSRRRPAVGSQRPS